MISHVRKLKGPMLSLTKHFHWTLIPKMLNKHLFAESFAISMNILLT